MRGTTLRRLMHAASALVLVLPTWVGWEVFPFVVTGGVVAGWALEVVRLTNARVAAGLAHHVPVFRAVETRQPSGAAWLGAAYLVAAWFPPPVPVAAILIAALADPAASLAGARLAPGHRERRKTMAGSAAHAVVAGVVLGALAYPWPTAVGVALLATALERWSAPLDDNLIVAPSVAVALTLLG